MFSLEGRTALVTGGGRGIGRAIAVALAAQGARVAVAARSASELGETCEAIAAVGPAPASVTVDLAPSGAAEGLVACVEQLLGPIDVLVNNAGIGSSADPKPVAEFDDAFWELTLTLNLTVPYRLCKAVLPAMRAKRFGRLINVASINGKIPSLHGVAYTASKHGLLGLTKTLALELAREGITANAICPGPVHTAMNDRRIAYDVARTGQTFEAIERAMTPIGGRLEPEDIAPLAVFLASDEARMITGQSYNVDGGIVMAG